MAGDGPGTRAGGRRGTGHAARALLRPHLRLRDHPGHRLRRRGSDLGRPDQRAARARRALVGVGRVRLADEHDQPRGGRGPDRDVRRDGRDADRVTGGAGRLRRRRLPLRVRVRLRSDRASRALRDRRAGRPRPARGNRPARRGDGDRRRAPVPGRRPRRSSPGGCVGARARARPARRLHRRRQGLAPLRRPLRRAARA